MLKFSGFAHLISCQLMNAADTEGLCEQEAHRTPYKLHRNPRSFLHAPKPECEAVAHTTYRSLTGAVHKAK